MPAIRRQSACIVLAAGSALRFGSDKRLATLADGRGLLASTLASVPDLFACRILVLKAGEEELAAALAPDWLPVYTTEAARGMGYSLRAGLSALPAACEAALVALGDMPRVQPGTWQALAAALHPQQLVVPRFAGKRGNPVGIGRDFFPDLLKPTGDRGARDLIRERPEAVYWLDCMDPGILVDMARPSAMEG